MNHQITKRIARAVFPENWCNVLRSWLRWRWFRGNYRSWDGARADSCGYDSAEGLQRIIDTTRTVVSGRACWDRDGVAFQYPEVNQPLLDVLKVIIQETGGCLGIVDFGGALGSTWRQHQQAFAIATQIDWRVVEQPHYVHAGREFADEVLSFHLDIQAALKKPGVSTILLSGVLQYLENPKQLLAEISRLKIEHIVIDRLSLSSDGVERITVQHTPKALGGASYPAWLFAREQLFVPILSNYHLVREWKGRDDVDAKAYFRGYYFRRILP